LVETELLYFTYNDDDDDDDDDDSSIHRSVNVIIQLASSCTFYKPEDDWIG
jgi:hypothetical protein